MMLKVLLLLVLSSESAAFMCFAGTLTIELKADNCSANLDGNASDFSNPLTKTPNGLEDCDRGLRNTRRKPTQTSFKMLKGHSDVGSRDSLETALREIRPIVQVVERTIDFSRLQRLFSVVFSPIFRKNLYNE